LPPPSSLFLLHSPAPPRDLHSFPTRRSSDLPRRRKRLGFTQGARPLRPPEPGADRRAGGVRGDPAQPGDERSAGRVERPQTVHRSEEHTSELQSRSDLVCRLLLEKKKKRQIH